MENANTNPFLVALFFIVRCLVPLLLMLGVSYLLKRFGLIASPPEPPPDQDNGNNNNDQNHHPNNGEGGLAHV
jgi:hypothetical protein